MTLKSTRKLKVFHGLVNYGTQAGLFARELRKNGIDAISVVYPDPFKRLTDVELLHGGNILQKIIKHSFNWLRRIYWFFRYNTFHFYFGTTLFPRQLDLPLYRFFGKKVVMEYLGWDLQLYKHSIAKYELTNAKYYKTPEDAIAGDEKKIKRLRYESKYINKQLICAPYLAEFLPSAEVLPLAFDVDSIEFIPKGIPEKNIKILHAPTHYGNKGTKFIQEAIEKLKKEQFDIEYKIVSGISHTQLIQEYIMCDIFIDQIVSGWYGTASIEAMAVGRPTICFIRETYFEYINYGDKIPLIIANPYNIYEVLKKTIIERDKLPEIGIRSRRFVEDIHNVTILTQRLIEIYKSL
jgi:hypothetical protein